MLATERRNGRGFLIGERRNNRVGVTPQIPHFRNGTRKFLKKGYGRTHRVMAQIESQAGVSTRAMLGTQYASPKGEYMYTPTVDRATVTTET
jgi:hypothetical protein